MQNGYASHARELLDRIRADGFYKSERVIGSPQAAAIRLAEGKEVLNFCANNYLGLADDPRLVDGGAARGSTPTASAWRRCASSAARRACTSSSKARCSASSRTEDTILYSICFDANGGLFETLLGEEDAVISDELNHASIIDGIRLCKAKRFRYRNNDMARPRGAAEGSRRRGARFKLIATDGVFSMDGIVANLRAICDLADRYGALVMVDDSHAVGFVGEGGRGTPEHCGVEGRIDILTGTLGKALGGASGGYTSRAQGDRRAAAPALAPVSLLQFGRPDDRGGDARGARAAGEVRKVRSCAGACVKTAIASDAAWRELGFDLVPGQHPIIPVMLGDAALATRMADALLAQGIYVIGFSYPGRAQGQGAHPNADERRAH